MNTTYKSLKVRKGGVNGVPSWRKIAQMAQDAENTRRANLANLPDIKAEVDAQIESQTDEKLSGTVTAENITADLLELWGEL